MNQTIRRTNVISQIYRTACLCVIVLSVCMSSPALVNAQESPPSQLTISITPDHITLSADGTTTRQVLIVVTNNTTNDVSKATLTWFGAPNLMVSSDPAQAQAIAPSASTVWMLQIDSPPYTGSEKALYLRLDYQIAIDGKTRSRSVTKSIALDSLAVVAVNDLLKIDVRAPTESISDTRPNTATLLLNNTSALTLTIGLITMRPATSLSATIVQTDVVRVPPRTTALIEAMLKATNTIQPGKRNLIFEIPVMWDKDGILFKGRTIVSTEASVGVTGETEILTALGIPSLLLLPGFLIIVAAFGTYRVSTKQANISIGSNLSALSAEGLLLAITCSLATLWIYPFIPLIGRNYLAGYSLADISSLWGFSIITGVTIGLIGFVGVKYTVDRAEQRKQALEQEIQAKRFREGDDALTTLNKLALRSESLRISKIRWKQSDAAGDYLAFLLERDTTGKLWIAPAIKAKTSSLEQFEALNQMLQQGNTRQVLEAIQKAIAANEVSLQWGEGAGIDHPTLIDPALVINDEAAQFIVEPEL